jgi:hypothetical protein
MHQTRARMLVAGQDLMQRGGGDESRPGEARRPPGHAARYDLAQQNPMHQTRACPPAAGQDPLHRGRGA